MESTRRKIVLYGKVAKYKNYNKNNKRNNKIITFQKMQKMITMTSCDLYRTSCGLMELHSIIGSFSLM